MKKPVTLGLTALITVAIAGVLAQQASGVNTLRGAAVDAPVALDDLHGQVENRMQRNCRQQPPLIPHKIDQYQVDIRTNQCLSCHDWTKAGERSAPTLSMTHYLDREGNELDQIAGTRYFCNQCHVPQVNAPALIGNDFEPSSSIVR